MQNKGLVKWTAIILLVICAFYLSFSVVGAHYTKKAKEFAGGDVKKEIAYLDSLANKKVWLTYTLKEVRQNEIGLGLDLKGGMNVILELNADEVIDNLSGHNQDPTFRKALENAKKKKETSQKDFITLFIDELHALDPGARLSAIFGTLDMKDRINTNSTDAEVEAVLRDEMKVTIESSHKVLRNRIDRFGVVAPNLQKLEGSDRILVELPGVTEPERVRKLLQGSANLEFWEAYILPEVYDALVAADQVLAKTAGTAPKTEAPADTLAVSDSLATQTPADSAAVSDDLTALANKVTGTEETPKADTAATAMSAEHPLLSLLQLNTYNGQLAPSPIVGYARAADMAVIDSLLSLPRVKDVLPRNLKLLWGVKEVTDGSNLFGLYSIKVTRRDGQAALAGDVVTNAETNIKNRQGSQEVTVSMTMNAAGTKEWARLTKENVGRPIAIVLDDVVYSAPNVNSEIPNGVSSISGDFTVDEANDLANTLNSGKMAASVRIVQEDVVGPSLGQEAIRAGFVSFIVALVLLMIYMCLIYGFLPGIVADIALLINLFLTLGILASLHAVLTLAGIAGMVLTLGMAVDANVLIFERIKEELKKGKSMAKSVEEGYNNAFSAIIDSNVTTIITGFILYGFGTGPIRGFATTLIIGLICSFLTAVFLTRLFFEKWAAKGKLDKTTFTTSLSKNFLENTNFDFVGRRKVGFGVALGVVAAGLIALFTVGLNSGIDFTGGRNFVVRFDKPVTTGEVTNLLSTPFEGKVTVITISTEDQVRISTNYKVEENTPEVDAEIESKLYEGLKPLLKEGTTLEEFTSDYIQSSQKVGASMADDIKTGALIAVVLSLIVMAVYILIRFRDVAFSVGAFASVTFTSLSIFAMYALLWKIMPFTMEVDQNFVAAVLAIIGYSINDTIVVFDRIRETLGYYPSGERKKIFNEALNATLSRTFNTTTSTLLVVLIMFLFGGASMRSFTFAILVGIIFGVFATLFVATPIAYLINNRKFEKNPKEAARIAAKNAR